MSIQVGEGSTSGAQLPRAGGSDAEGDRPRADPVQAARPGPGKSVLYVEDNPVNAFLMQEILSVVPGLQLSVEVHGDAALGSARHQPPDLLLLDMQLPDMTGAELLGRLRKLPGLEHAPAVAVSADAMPQDIDAAHAVGFSAYWTKPLDIDRVRADVVRMLQA